MLRLLLISLAAWGLLAQGPVRLLRGQVTDGRRGLEGVRVMEDRPPRVDGERTPSVLTDAEGRFEIGVAGRAPRLVLEKEGWQRDFEVVPEGRPEPVLRLRPAPAFRKEKVLVVRLAFPDEEPALPEATLRRLLFSREPGLASAANYVYEVSKGSLVLEEGAFLTVQDRLHRRPRSDDQRSAMIEGVLRQLRRLDLRDFDRVNNRTGALKRDGKPDHLWILAPGPPRSVTNKDSHLKALCTLTPLPWNRRVRWPVVFATEEVPLGNLVHEAFHAMGEHRVDDLYMLEEPYTAGGWDLMDAGQYRGWDRHHPDDEGPWRNDTGYSPSHPMGWTRAELWYRGAFRGTVSARTLKEGEWSGWMDPLVKAPDDAPQRLLVPDPRRAGCFWEFNVRRPWGFDAGRVGNRWGPGYEGLVVARVDPSLLSDGDPRGPVRVLDAHPGSPEPPSPRYPNRRWELDDAAFNLGPGEAAKGEDGPLAWQVLETDVSGRMKVRVTLR